IADDIGSDFFCTLFERVRRTRHELLFPRNSFAIQVKTSGSQINMTGKIEYLEKLEIPFLLGIIDRSHLRMSIYSGEFLPILFSEHETPKKLHLAPVQEPVHAPSYCTIQNNQCTLKMPFVVTLSASDSRDELNKNSDLLRKLCTRVHENISARTSREYIFRLEENGEETAYLMAGSGSYKRFRYNFCLRLAEAFYNLEWLDLHPDSQIDMNEFKVFEQCYFGILGLIKHGFPVPELLLARYGSLKKRLTSKRRQPTTSKT
ncbi:MAG TPA: hypothetical protein VGP65_12490, partial [Candidatus Angelobacter sp.]|nr:hypothetical protein [Candidatus Angelobacter sp.]